MRFRIKIKRAERKPPAGMFAGCMLRNRAPYRGILLSTAAHCGLIALVAAAAQQQAFWRDEEFDLSRYRVEPVSVLVPRRIYYEPRTAASRPPAAPPAARAFAAVPAGVSQRRLRVVVEPPPEVKRWQGPTVLQPQLHEFTARQSLPLAAVLAWSPAQPDAVPRPAGKTIVPGRRADSAAGQVNVPPRTDVPNREPARSDLNIASAPVPAEARLPRPPAATTPARIGGDPDTAKPAAMLDMLPGEAANLIILSHAAPPATYILTVPPGSVVESAAPDARPATAHAGGSAAGTSAAQTARAATPAAATRPVAPLPDLPGLLGQRSLAAALETARAAAAAALAAGGSVSNVANVLSSAVPGGHAAGRGGSETTSSPESAWPPSELIRNVYPADAAVDVVVVQSSAGGGNMPRVALPGQPVYTVYLDLGSAKPWVFQYCEPGNPQKAGQQERFINLGAPEGLTPPHPTSTAIPRQPVSKTAHVLIRGLLRATGRLQDLRFLENQDQALRPLLALLETWQFRPVMKGARAIDVEVLIAIPPGGIS